VSNLFSHQRDGVAKLVENSVFALFDEMGVGKSKQVIEAAQVLYARGEIERVLVVCPAAVRAVWYDYDLGELRKHLWPATPARVTEYHQRLRTWVQPIDLAPRTPALEWRIVNYDFIRNPERLEDLEAWCAERRTWLVLDESSAVKNHKARQTKACARLRKACTRVTLLNGTPVANSPGDLYAQAVIMDRRILDCKSWFHFRARYGVLGGFQGRQVVAWQNLEDLQRRLAPHTLRRLKVDVLKDLPAKLPPVALTATLTDETWKLYRGMRDELVAWLSDETVAVAAQAGVRAMRLSQLTSGFLGGLITSTPCAECEGVGVGPAGDACQNCGGQGVLERHDPPREIGREKLDVFLEWLSRRFDEDPHAKILVWCRFRPELERLERELLGQTRLLRLEVGKIWGGQDRDERERTLRLLDPRTAPSGPVVVVGTPQSGSMGLNLAAAHDVMYVSNDYSLKTRLQSEDRVHRPGQVYPVSYFDVEAVGPRGQRTIDHTILRALRAKQDLANWTCAAWRASLVEE